MLLVCSCSHVDPVVEGAGFAALDGLVGGLTYALAERALDARAHDDTGKDGGP